MNKKVQKVTYRLLSSALFALVTVLIPFLWNVAMVVCYLHFFSAKSLFRRLL